MTKVYFDVEGPNGSSLVILWDLNEGYGIRVVFPDESAAPKITYYAKFSSALHAAARIMERFEKEGR
jgi:hypothetical protein